MKLAGVQSKSSILNVVVATSLFALSSLCLAQRSSSEFSSVNAAVASWPDAPDAANQQESTQPSSATGQSAPQDPATGTTGQTQHEKAEEQIKEQEKQRILGVVPMFNTSYLNDAVSLTAGQKMRLAFRSAIDPVTFGVSAVVAGFGELGGGNNNNGFGWGADGYAKRWGAAYLDSFSGTMIGNGILPSLLHQDPRYFRLGKGTTTHRMLYAMSTTVICKHDNTGRWEPNYSNVGGNFIAGTISNLYYPSTPERNGWEQTITSALVVTAEGAAGGLFQEFWPDISRKLFKRDPTHGLDAQARAADAAAKAAKKKNKTSQPLPPAPK